MSRFDRAVLAIVVAVLLAGGWFFRWEVTSVAGGDGGGRAYMLNRWTGALYYLSNYQRSEVDTIK